MHGANRTGRPFTGDYAGILLYQTLQKFGFSNGPATEDPNDGLQLIGCRITNSVKCLPPGNQPLLEEIRNCNAYLTNEIQAISTLVAVLTLGGVAHKAALMALNLRPRDYPFRHGTRYTAPNGLRLYSSYHCSRYNTQTNRLTTEMFESVFRRISEDLRAKRQG